MCKNLESFSFAPEHCQKKRYARKPAFFVQAAMCENSGFGTLQPRNRCTLRGGWESTYFHLVSMLTSAELAKKH